MSKLSKENQFFDFSDYGRPIARLIANSLKNTRTTPVQVTYMFGISGLMAIYCMLNEYYIASGIFLILKSILDAADGELARLKNTPSYTGRYLDSIFDIILNFAFLLTICFITDGSVILTLLAFFAIQMQGTVYNFYYVILRHKMAGDKTSRIFETEKPKALGNENQTVVNILFSIYLLLYGIFDKIIYVFEKDAVKPERFPNWFMSLVSLYGLGFQLLLIAFFLSLNLKNYIISFFIYYSILIFVLVFIRKNFIKE